MSEKRGDRIGMYLVPHLEEFLFDELSDGYLERAGIADILMGVPIPIRKTAMKSLTTLDIARNMAFVIGCDPGFDFAANYIAYIKRVFPERFVEALIGAGVDAAAKEDFDYACIQFRAAILIDPESADALYCYGRACKDLYERGEDEEYIGRYKAESLDAFEKVTLKRPDYADAFYFLGYGYINLVLYVKAKLTWEEFLKLTCEDAEKIASGEASDATDLTRRRKDVADLLMKLDEPVKIEEGYNLVLSGRFQEGIAKLTQYTDGQYAQWWPLWYYLGVAYGETDCLEDAEAAFLKVLQLSPSNIETMEALAGVYEALGNTEKAAKYRGKIEVVKSNMALDKAEAANANCNANANATNGANTANANAAKTANDNGSASVAINAPTVPGLLN